VQAIHELRRGSLGRKGAGGRTHGRSSARRWGRARDRPFARRYECARGHGRRRLLMHSSRLRTDLRDVGRSFPVDASDHRGRSLDMLRPSSVARWERSSESTEQVECHVERSCRYWGESMKVGVNLLLTRDIKSTW
jgi:hypothetical protein